MLTGALMLIEVLKGLRHEKQTLTFSMRQTWLIDKNRYWKSLDIIDINRFNPPINID